MPNLTPQQIKEAMSRGVSQEQINNYVGKNMFPKKTRVEKVGDFIGVTPIAKGIAQIAFSKTKVGKDLEKKVQENTATPEEYQAYADIRSDTPNPREVIAGSAKTALSLGTLGTGSIAKNVIGRTIEGGVLGATFQVLDNLQKGEELSKNVGTASLVGGAIPLVGTGIKKGLNKFLGTTAEKIEKTLIKPSKIDVEDGFRVENIQKYGITGNLTQKAQKIEQRLSDLTKQLREKLGSRSDAVVDLNQVMNKTFDDVIGNTSKTFGESEKVLNVFKGLGQEIENVSGNGLIDLTEAQVVKQAAGKKGAWIFGFVDPDSRANELVYSKFYRNLREEIEKKAPQGVREINKQIGELIPIMHAIIRRIPVAERSSALSLTDLITGGFAIGNPKAIGLFALNRALKSGSVANALAKTSQLLEKTPKSGIGQRIFGR